MMSKYPREILGELISHQKGSPFKSKDYQESGIAVVRVSNFTEDSIDTKDLKFVNKEVAQDNRKVVLKTNDILIATVGSWPKNPASIVGKTISVPSDMDGALMNQNSVILRVKSECEIDQKYLFIALKTKKFSDYLVSTAQGSANQASVTLKDMFLYEVEWPRFEIRKSIVSMIDSMNQKIKLNLQTNQTLEHMAQAIFKSWFVDFEPTRAKIAAKEEWAKRSMTGKTGGSDNNIKESQAAATFVERAAMAAISGRAIDSTNDSATGTLAGLDQLNPEQNQQLKTTAALFPDSLVDSELGEIPEGWGVKSLSDYIDVKHGYAFKGEYFSDEATDNILLTPGNFKVGGGLKLNKLKYYDGPMPEGYILKRNDLLVTMTDLSKQSDTLGFPALVSKVGNFTFLHNQRLGKIISKGGELKKYFLYFLLKSYNYRSEIVGGATGTTVKHTAPKKILAFTHPFQSDLASEFDVIACALYSKIEGNFNNSEVLKKLRDALLPKLLSGDLNVEGDCHEFR